MSQIRGLVVGAIISGAAAWMNWDGHDEATLALAVVASNWILHRLLAR